VTSIHRAATTAAFLLGIGLLSACSAPPAMSPTPSAGSPSAEPTSESSGQPESSLPITCEDVIPSDLVTAAFVTPVQLRFDENSTPTGIRGTTFVQGGGLSCLWGGEPSGTGFHEGLRFDVVAASEAEFDAGAWVQEGAVLDTIGDRSVLACTLQTAGGYTCNADLLVGEYWIDAFIGDGGESPTAEHANETATDLLTQVAESVGSAGAPRPLWSAPSEAFDGESLCSDPAHVAAAVGLDPTALSVVPNPFPAEGVQGIAESRTSVVTCQWLSGETSVMLTTLQGGGWWADLLAAAPPTDAPHYRAPVPIEVPGVDAAYLAGNDGGSVVILFTQGSAVSFDLRELDPALATAAAVAFAATLLS
jgi:hypothetical protein